MSFLSRGIGTCTLFLSLVFMFMVVAGTLFHESGHFLAAKIMGYGSSVHYNYTLHDPPGDVFWITLGGPLFTIFAGSAAFILLCAFRRRLIVFDHVKWQGWVLIFLSLFWLRPVVNFIAGLIFHGAFHGDEYRIAIFLGWKPLLFIILNALAGTLVSVIVFFLIPARFRLSFVLAGIVGGGLGYYVWMIRLGPGILP